MHGSSNWKFYYYYAYYYYAYYHYAYYYAYYYHAYYAYFHYADYAYYNDDDFMLHTAGLLWQCPISERFSSELQMSLYDGFLWVVLQCLEDVYSKR